MTDHPPTPATAVLRFVTAEGTALAGGTVRAFAPSSGGGTGLGTYRADDDGRVVLPVGGLPARADVRVHYVGVDGVAHEVTVRVAPGTATVTVPAGAVGPGPVDRARLESAAGVTRRRFVADLAGRVGDAAARDASTLADAQLRLLGSISAGLRTEIAADAQAENAAESPAAAEDGSSGCGCPGCADALSPAAYLADLLGFATRELQRIAGLIGTYHRGNGLADPYATRRDATVDVDLDAAGQNTPPGVVSVRWAGQVQSRWTGACTFVVHTPGGVRLRVRDRLLIDDWAGRGIPQRSGTIFLRSGVWSDIVLECALDPGGRTVGLAWWEAGRAEQTVAAARLRADGAGGDVTLADLVEQVCQPLDRLPAGCAGSEACVRQARICVEVLRRYLDLMEWTPPDLVETAYRTLLRRLGTSFEELREVVSGDDRLRRPFAVRLGIDWHPATSPADCDELDLLAADTRCTGGLTEDTLAFLFGLRDTRADPLAADPVPMVAVWRADYLRRRWSVDDGAARRPLDLLPLIDPDLVGPPDFVDTTPSAGPAAPWNPCGLRGQPGVRMPMHIWQDRQAWTQMMVTEMADGRRVAGLPALIKDPFYGLPDPEQPPTVTVAELAGLRDQLRSEQPGPARARLEALRLSPDELDVLVTVGRADPAKVLDSEWRDLYDVLLRTRKRACAASWVREEQEAGLSLGPAQFRIRPVDGVDAWRPRKWRADLADRRRWEALLRERTDAEQAVWQELRDAVTDVEATMLPMLRDTLVFEAAGRSLDAGADWVTNHLFIDGGMDGCACATRTAQAIATVQELAIAIRQHDTVDTLTMAGTVEQFDAAWRWLGSYDTWRSVMAVFLYPENALRPTLRRERSPVFDALVRQERSAGRSTPASALAAATAYGRYFADVCSLHTVALVETVEPLGDWPRYEPPTGYAVALAGAGASGGVYSSTFTVRRRPPPGSGPPAVLGAADQTFWTRLPDVPAGSQVLGTLVYRGESRRAALLVYLRASAEAGSSLLYATDDGTDWRAGTLQAPLPPLMCTGELYGAVPSGPGTSDIWPLAAGDRFLALDVDGDERPELLVIAAPGTDGTRPIGLLREQDGTLVTGWAGRLPAGWRLPDPDRPVILTRQLPGWPWRVDRLLVVNDSGPRIGLLGWQPGMGMTVLWSTGDPGGGPLALANTVDGTVYPTVFVAAQLDGVGMELLAFEHRAGDGQWSPVNTTVTVLDTGGDRLQVRATQRLRFPFAAHPYWGQGFDVIWSGFTPLRSAYGPSGSTDRTVRDIAVRTERTEWVPHNVGEIRSWVAEGRCWMATLRWDWRANAEFPSGHFDITLYPDTVPDPAGGGVTLAADDEHVAFGSRDLGAFLLPPQSLLLWSPSLRRVAVLGYDGGGRLQTRWQTTGQLPAGAGGGPGWTLHAGDRFVETDVDGDRDGELLLYAADGQRLGLVRPDAARHLAVQWTADGSAPGADPVTGRAWRLPGATSARIAAADLDNDGYTEVVVVAADGRLGVLGGVAGPRAGLPGLLTPSGPRGVVDTDVVPWRSTAQIELRRQRIAAAYAANPYANSIVLACLDEAYYFLPVELGLRLAEHGEYGTALDWLRSVYDYGRPVPDRKIAAMLVREEQLDLTFERAAEWLTDPVNPHLVAVTRRHSYTRYTVIVIVRCLLDLADAAFTAGGPADIEQARSGYLLALALMETPELAAPVSSCDDFPAGPTMAEVLNRDAEAIRALPELLDTPAVAAAVGRVGAAVPGAMVDATPLRLTFQFCVPPNTVVDQLRSRARLNVQKIRTCRDISGVEVTPLWQPTPYRYSVLIERARALVQQAANVEAAMLTALERRDQEYYELMRARQDVDLARAGAQLQEMRVRAVQDRVVLLNIQAERAQIQVDTYAERIEAGLNTWEEAMIRGYERAAWNTGTGLALGTIGGVISSIAASASPWGAAGAAIGGGIQMAGAAYSAQAATEQSRAQVASVRASHERQREDWELNRRLAEQDTLAALAQIAQAGTDVAIEQQQHDIDVQRVDNAEDLTTFLATKFTSFDLYDLISGVLGDVYRFFLHQATAVARAAADQLAFERQTPSPAAMIRSDYWRLPDVPGAVAPADGTSTDLRGLTGSARLTRDLYQLDQYAFGTARRRAELTKVFSLGELEPFGFEQFRRTGVLRFTTPMRLFERDFPGHYVRLIRQVRCTVVALIPPPQGIHATLVNSGLSRVVVGDDLRTVELRREPETVDLTASFQATGRFELEPVGDLALPFEWTGVDTSWELRLPRPGNQFDYDSIAGILFSVDYTALDSPRQRDRVLAAMDPTVTADRPFSMRDELVDQWYDLHNVEATAPELAVSFTTTRQDFPPNLDGLIITRVALLFVQEPANTQPVTIARLTFTPSDGGNAYGGPGTTDAGGLVSSRPGGGGQWGDIVTGTRPVTGRWELAFANTEAMRRRFDQDQIRNIVLVVTYTADLPPWPAA